MGFHAAASFGTAVRVARGARNDLAGRMAEDCVARHYAQRGCRILAQRWRSGSGEIDLILTDGEAEDIVFVEVKCARTHDEAAWRISHRQAQRIMAAATDYCAGLASGMRTPMRFDAALVDAMGRISIIENAIGDW